MSDDPKNWFAYTLRFGTNASPDEDMARTFSDDVHESMSDVFGWCVVDTEGLVPDRTADAPRTDPKWRWPAAEQAGFERGVQAERARVIAHLREHMDSMRDVPLHGGAKLALANTLIWLESTDG